MTTLLRRSGSLLLIAPSVLFVSAVLLVPLVVMLHLAVDNRSVGDALPRTLAAIETWDGLGTPAEDVHRALVADLIDLNEVRGTASLGRRLNYEWSGFSSLMRRTGGTVEGLEPPFRDALIAVDERWSSSEPWLILRQNTSNLTPFFLLSAVDLERSPDGSLQRTDEDERIFIAFLARSFWIALVVTILCLVLGYPVAYLLSQANARTRNLLIILVLFPFWTSVIVRTAAWFILLQRNGPINGSLVALGILDEPTQLIFTRLAVYIGMVHLMLPFMVLPLLSTMRTIPAAQLKAAGTLGAPPLTALFRVFVPQTRPGIEAGCVLVFVQTLGFYITPLLLGGGADQMISALIAYYANVQVNWAMSSALAVLLLFSVAMVFAMTRLAHTLLGRSAPGR